MIQGSVLIGYNRLIGTLSYSKLLGPDGEMACVRTLQSADAGSKTDKVAFKKCSPSFQVKMMLYRF